MKSSLDRYEWILVSLGIATALILAPYSLGIEGDGRFYYAYLPSLFLDGDLDFSNQYAQYDPAWLAIYKIDAKGSRPPNWVPIGTAIFWSPFFLLAQGLTALTVGDASVPPGYSVYHMSMVFVGSFCYVIFGLILLYRKIKEYYPPVAVFAGVAGSWLATFLVWYQAIEPSYSHAIDFFIAVVILCTWLKWRERPENLWLAILLGLTTGLGALVRWQNFGFLVLPAVDLIRIVLRNRKSVPTITILGRTAIVGVLAITVFAGIQFTIWKILFGQYIMPYPYRAEWASPFAMELLFSTRNGLFTWTPIAYFAILGLAILTRNNLALGVPLFVLFATQVYLSTTPPDWYAGWSYGMRRLSNCLPLLAFGLTAMVDLMMRRQRTKLAVAAMVILTWWNFSFMKDYYTFVQPHAQTFSFVEVVKRRYQTIGNPFSFPANWLFALRYRVSPALYDLVVGDYFLEFGHLGNAIDFSNPRYRPLLIEGWGGNEGSDSIWAVGTHSRILLPLYLKKTYTLEFHVFAFRIPNSDREQVMEVQWNGKLVGNATVPANGNWAVLTFKIPKRIVRRGVNELEVSYAYAVSPRELGMSADPRKLSVRFRKIVIKEASK